MKISNKDDSIQIIGHAAPMVNDYVDGGNIQIKIGCIGIHMPHDDCDGIQAFTWMASQGESNIAYGMALIEPRYIKRNALVMSLEVDYVPHGETALATLMLPDSVRKLYERSKTQADVNKGLAAFGADMRELKKMFGMLGEMLKIEGMNPDSDVLLFCPPVFALDMDLTGAPSMTMNDEATQMLNALTAGIISATERLAKEGDNEEDDDGVDEETEALINELRAALKEAGLLRDDGTPEEESVPLGLDAKKFFREHLN